MRTTRTAAAALALAPLTLAACTGVTPPTFRITGVELVERSADASLVLFTVEGDNPNRQQLPLDTVRYTMTLEGRAPFTAQRSAQATLPGFGTQTFTVPVAITDDAGGVPTGKSGYSISGNVEYRIPGSIADLLFDNDIRRPTQPFGESGTLDFTNASQLINGARATGEDSSGE